MRVTHQPEATAAAAAAPPTLAWSFTINETMKSDPTIAPDGRYVYIGNDDGYLYALEMATGKMHWRFRTAGKVWAGPSLGPNSTVVYIGSADRHEYAISTTDGKLRWSFAADGQVPSPAPQYLHSALTCTAPATRSRATRRCHAMARQYLRARGTITSTRCAAMMAIFSGARCSVGSLGHFRRCLSARQPPLALSCPVLIVVHAAVAHCGRHHTPGGLP